MKHSALDIHFGLARGALIVAAAALIPSCSNGGGGGFPHYRDVIARGLRGDFNTTRIPVGGFTIMSPLEASTTSFDVKERKFPPAFLTPLYTLKQRGLLELTQYQQSSLESIGNMGATRYSARPTEKLRDLADTAWSKDQYLIIPLGTVTLEKIVLDTSYVTPQMTPADKYRMVLGTYHVTQSQWTKDVFPGSKDGSYRFKAVVKYDPFSKNWLYVGADWGALNNDTWVTKNLR